MMDANDPLENLLSRAAAEFPYPATPRVRSRTARPWSAPPRRLPALRTAALAAVLVLVSLFAVAPVRAAVLDFIRIGVVRIFPAGLPGFEAPPATPIPILQSLSGQTTLADAAAAAPFPLRYPAELGEPDYVYYQDQNGPLVLMIWAEGEGVRVSLLALGPDAFVGKGAPPTLIQTRVSGEHAVWLPGAHQLFLQTAQGNFDEFILYEAGSTLLWERGPITYRLEGNLELEAAIHIAESLVDWE